MQWLLLAERIENELDTLLKIDLVLYDRASETLRDQLFNGQHFQLFAFVDLILRHHIHHLIYFLGDTVDWSGERRLLREQRELKTLD